MRLTAWLHSFDDDCVGRRTLLPEQAGDASHSLARFTVGNSRMTTREGAQMPSSTPIAVIVGGASRLHAS